MTAWLDPELTSVAFCWRLERRDGVAMGFTSHDRDLDVGTFRYVASPGMVPSAISLSDGFDVDTLDVTGALTNDAVTAADMAAGRWDGARVRLFAVDWSNPSDAPLFLARGELGEVTIRDGAFTAELRGPTALLERPVVEATSPECRAELGDRRCGVAMAGRTRIVRVVAVAGSTLTLNIAEPSAGAYSYGRLRWLGGANSGLGGAILSSTGVQIVVRDATAAPVAVGDRAEIAEGCDKTFATCRTRFANGAAFRGEPHLPGTDILTRYPGA